MSGKGFAVGRSAEKKPAPKESAVRKPAARRPAPGKGLGTLAAAAFAAAVLLSGPPPAAAQAGPVFARAVDRAVDRVIAPGYADLASAAGGLAVAMSGLCADPTDGALAAARASFAKVVTAFSRVELLRLGPAREDHRFERLFFWPDRRGRGRRQIEALIAGKDEATLDAAALRKKSVAVQGLLALEYVLAGKGSEGLASGRAAFRCRQGLAVAGAVDRTVRRIRRGWAGPEGFGAVMRGAGPGNPVYRSHGEAVADLLGAAGEQLRIVERLKLARMLRDGPESARPKAAPFWRSGLARASIAANLDGVLRLLDEAALGTLLPASEAGLAERAASELREAREALSVTSGFGPPGAGLPALLSDPGAHRRLAAAAARVGTAAALLGEDFPRALGLVPGFNSLDGD